MKKFENDKTYAEILSAILTSDSNILSIPLYNAKSDKLRIKKVNCKLDGLTVQLATFKTHLLKLAVTYHSYVLLKKLADINKKLDKEDYTPSSTEKIEAENLAEFVEYLKTAEEMQKFILTKEKISRFDGLTKSLAAYLSGYNLPGFWKNEDMNDILNAFELAYKASTKEAEVTELKYAKKRLSFWIHCNFKIGEEDNNPLFSALKGNGGILKNIMTRAYGGRKYNSEGEIVQGFNRNATRTEILLGILDYKRQVIESETLQPEEVTRETKTA